MSRLRCQLCSILMPYPSSQFPRRCSYFDVSKCFVYGLDSAAKTPAAAPERSLARMTWQFVCPGPPAYESADAARQAAGLRWGNEQLEVLCNSASQEVTTP